MQNPFATDEMALGYATSRPPVHRPVLDLAYKSLGRNTDFDCALDVGCGAGISTRALQGLANQRIGMEPAEGMLLWSQKVAPGARFLVGKAEALPLADQSIDLITAAGSLNYVDLPTFCDQARRVLAPNGVLLVYDFSAGKSFRESSLLDEWFHRFTERYPWPSSEARHLNPEILSQNSVGFELEAGQDFEIGIELSPDFYLDYMLTETNVAAAVRGGTPLESIRHWCSSTLKDVWAGKSQQVLFRGYFACLRQRI